MTPWQILSSKTLVNERWLELREEHVRLANGHEIERFHVIRGPDWASVLCVTESDQVVLVRQYRHGIARASLELPAGVIEANETPEQGARRELAEETGFESNDWQLIHAVSTEPARHTTRAHFFCARGARRTRAVSFDASEELEQVLVPRSELRGLALSGAIEHGVHVG